MSRGEAVDFYADEQASDRLRGTIAPDALPVALVSAFAGDRVMDDAEGARIQSLKDSRRTAFYSDLLYAISHHYFVPEIAEGIWNQVLAHKLAMSAKLGRNVRITVATLDYLSNITGEIRSLTLMSETRVAEIVNLSMRDGMTGLFNHSTCYELLELELRSNRRYGVGVALILLDIDDFKSVNDRWGHQEGDSILIELAAELRNATRDSDICCRFGGEEFAVILPFVNDPREAHAIAERIRLAVTTITRNGQAMAISAGVAMCDGSIQTSHALVARADRALYRAKQAGKNRVVLIADPLDPRDPEPR
jgi:diguanylate cyclase (GGDEF)-like protein